jgi:hypothetical protein
VEDQFLANADYVRSEKSRLGARIFYASDSKTITFPGNFFNPSPNIPGFASPNNSGYRVISLHHTYALNSARINELRFGYVRTTSRTQSHAPFKWSDIGVAEGDMSETNALPNLNILGSVAFSSAFPFGFAQNSFVVTEDLVRFTVLTPSISEDHSHDCRTTSTIPVLDRSCSF